MFAAAAFFFFWSSLSLSLLHHLPVSSLSVCLCWLSSSHGAGKENVNYSSVPKKRRGGWFNFNLIQQFYWSKCRDMFTFRSPAPSWRLQPSFSSHLSFPRTTLLLVTNMVLRKKREINASATCSLIWGDF